MSEIDELISAQLDGELDEAGHRRLEEWLAADPEHRRRFLRQAIEHRALRERLLAQRAGKPRAVSARRRRPIRFPIALAALAAAALVIVLIHPWSTTVATPPPRSGEVVPFSATFALADAVTITTADGQHTDAKTGAGIALQDRIVVGDGGRAEIRLRDGTLLTLAANTTLSFVGRDAFVEIAKGRVAAEVTPQPKDHPLHFTTPEATVRVVGTSLTVARADGETLVEVTHGAVSVGFRGTLSTDVAAGQRLLVSPTLPLKVTAIDAPLGVTYAVGSGQPCATLDAVPDLQPGDVVEIHPGTYHAARSWKLSGTALRPVVIRGVGDQPPLIDGEGVDVSGVGAVPRALFQINGEHAVIEGIAFANAGNHANAAAIRLVDARHISIRRCRIARCDDGIACGDECDDLAIEDCDVGFCGAPESDGYCHDIYVGGGSAAVRGCDLHDALHGQALKSSCRRLELIGNRIRGAEDGEISFIDAPGTDAAGSDVVMIGNLVVSKPDRHGNHQRFIETDREGGGRRGGTLYLIGNTFVAGDPRNVFIATLGGMRVVADDNLFVGSDRIAQLGEGGISGRRNWLPPTAEVPAGLGDRVPGDDPGLADPAAGDYRLRSGSPCLEAGAEARYRDAAGRDRVAPPVGPATPLGVATRQGPPVVGAFGPAR